MECLELLTVENTFAINCNTVTILIIYPDFSVPNGGWQNCTEIVEVLQPNGQRIKATAEIATMHLNIKDPAAPIDKCWRVCIRLRDRTKAEVPIGSKILVSQVVRDALLTLPSSSRPE